MQYGGAEADQPADVSVDSSFVLLWSLSKLGCSQPTEFGTELEIICDIKCNKEV